MNFICWRIDTSVATENPSDCVLYLKIPCRFGLSIHIAPSPDPDRISRSRIVAGDRSLFSVADSWFDLRHVPGRSRVLTVWIAMHDCPKLKVKSTQKNPGARVGHRIEVEYELDVEYELKEVCVRADHHRADLRQF